LAKLPAIVSKEWENREGPVVFSTVDKDGNPNAIYATCTSKYSEEIILVANNYFSKTMDNIQTGSKGSILFITKEGKSYQIKGSIDYYTTGAIFDDMKKWNPERLPGHGAAALKVEEVYAGAEKLL
jgi:predicted pyridoxine 5'-phosphate oxidase superfamily flavin-nucleotide-binding protein